MIDSVTGEVIDEGVSAELIRTGSQSLVAAATPAETISRQVEIANELAKVVEDRKLYANVKGKRFVTVSGWQLLGHMCSVTAVVVDTQPVDGGFMATVEARRTTDGMTVGRAQALCTDDEKSGPWRTADRYARLSMAQTRATSKALRQALGPIMQLAGFESTPAEEMPVEQSAPSPVSRGQAETGVISSAGGGASGRTSGFASPKQQKMLQFVAHKQILTNRQFAHAMCEATNKTLTPEQLKAVNAHWISEALGRLPWTAVDATKTSLDRIAGEQRDKDDQSGRVNSPYAQKSAEEWERSKETSS